MGLLDNHPVTSAALVLAAIWLGNFLIKMTKHRRRFKNLPGPPHHPIFGHLPAMAEVASKLPKFIHPHVYVLELKKRYKLPSIFYVDLFPITESGLYMLDPDAGAEISSDPRMVKHSAFIDHLAPIAGMHNLLLSEGSDWKKQRAIFNPGFSTAHLMSQMPVILDIMELFVQALDHHAAQDKVFRMEEEATKFTIDIIGKVVLDLDFQSFTTQNEFVQALRTNITWMPDPQSLNPWYRNNPFRSLAHGYYKRRMDAYIGRVLDSRFKTRTTYQPSQRAKSGIDLALEAWFQEHGKNTDADAASASMDPEFRQLAIDNMLILLFAGHDTTASTICYCYHMLHQAPESLARLREELNDVFGAGVGAADRLREDPHLINKCEYLAAVVKETLRLWVPASTVRRGRSDVFVKDPVTGRMLPTEGFMVWPNLTGTHRDPALWGPTAHTFDPSRFLPPSSSRIPPNAYRPFEKGPRNCIGQELANLELKVALALTVREFDVRAALDEVDALKNDGSMWAKWYGSRAKGSQEYYGDAMYQVLMASAKPREGMPARVRRVGR